MQSSSEPRHPLPQSSVTASCRCSPCLCWFVGHLPVFAAFSAFDPAVANKCPAYAKAVDSAVLCKAAANALGFEYRDQNRSDLPKGCGRLVTGATNVFWNDHPVGQASATYAFVCSTGVSLCFFGWNLFTWDDAKATPLQVPTARDLLERAVAPRACAPSIQRCNARVLQHSWATDGSRTA